MDYLAAIDEDIMAYRVELLQVQSMLQSKAKKKETTAAAQIYDKIGLIQTALRRMTETGRIKRILDSDIHAGHLLYKRMNHYVDTLLDISRRQVIRITDSAYQEYNTAVMSILHAIDVFMLDIDGDASLKAHVTSATNIWSAYIATGNTSTDALHTMLKSIGNLMYKNIPKEKSNPVSYYLHAIGKALASGEHTKYITDDSDPPAHRGNDIDLEKLLTSIE